MEFANRKFRNNRTGEIVKVIDTFENIAILENKQKVDVRQLADPAQFTEEIDPTAFFNTQGAYNILAEKIKNIPTNMMNDDAEEIVTKIGGEINPAINESAIVMTTEEDEMAELARKYGIESNPTQQLQNQQNAFAKLLGEDSEDLPVVTPFRQEEPVMRVEVDRGEKPQQPVVAPQIPNQQHLQDDPITTMFKKAKRNIEFSVNFEISNKIPRLDFIEMMEDSYETSIIDFLSEEFTNEVINNPGLIKESIKNRIKEIVYSTKKTPVNSQITDAVTQVEKHEPLSIEKEPVLSKDLPKKTTTRRSRAKKENINND